MLRNYLAAALRNLVRNRIYVGVNIIGLSVGFAAALLIALFIRDELTFDHYFPGHARIYLLGTHQEPPGRAASNIDMSASEYAKQLMLDYPSIEESARVSPMGGFEPVPVRYGDKELGQSLLWADPTLFNILKFKTVSGSLDHALERPDSIVLTQAMARRYFGDENPIGKSLEVDRKAMFTVTAVIEDLPYNIHLSGDAIIAAHAPISPLEILDANPAPPDAFYINSYTYLKIQDQAAAQRIEDDLPEFLRRHKRLDSQFNPQLHLLPLTDLHFVNGTAGTPDKPRGSMEVMVAAAAIGALIVLAASVNFINLMTARAARRAPEVGIRKTSGAARYDLIVQFIGESVIYVALSMALGLLLAALLLPSLNSFLGRTIQFLLLSDLTLVAFVLALALAVGLLAGTYPAFVLSAFRPAVVLKAGSYQGQGSSSVVRQGLVVLQFSFLIGLLIATAVITRQIDFALTKAQRLDTDEVLLLDRVGCRGALKDAIAALPGVRQAVCSTGLGLSAGRRTRNVKRGDAAPLATQIEVVEPGVLEFYGLTPVAGRFFDGRTSDGKAEAAQSTIPAIVINEAAVRRFGFASAQAAIGQSLFMREDTGAGSEIVGVMPDFAGDTIREPVSPAAFYVDPTGYFGRGPNGPFEMGMLSVRLKGEDIPETLAAIDKTWIATGQPHLIARHFLNQSLQQRYVDITRQSTLFAVSAGIAIFIALLGLFGMAAFISERRTKEIGVRKAMGAKQGDIVRLLIWQFLKPVLLGNVVAWPVAYYFMNRWLEGFANHIRLEAWMFLAAAASAIIIALVTVGAHSVLVARIRPIGALRYE